MAEGRFRSTCRFGRSRGRSPLYVIGILLVIPAPWVATSFYRWIVSRTYVPGRPNIAFNGQVGDIWYVFIVMALMNYAGEASNYLQLIAIPVLAFLSWMVVRWIAGNLSSDGQPLPIAFNGDALTFVGWQVLMFLAVFTIIGWAWVVTAWIRWICRNIDGTQREIIFNASGLEMLWRTIVFAIGCAFLIPIEKRMSRNVASSCRSPNIFIPSLSVTYSSCVTVMCRKERVSINELTSS